MLYISLAIVISIAFIVFGKPSLTLNLKHQYIEQEVKKAPVTEDMYDADGDIKAEFDDKSVTMDEYIQQISSFMVDTDVASTKEAE